MNKSFKNQQKKHLHHDNNDRVVAQTHVGSVIRLRAPSRGVSRAEMFMQAVVGAVALVAKQELRAEELARELKNAN